LINEIKFQGVESIDNNDPTLTCDAKLVIGSEEDKMDPVTFKDSLTSSLSSVSPRYGPVTGGTQVTFTGVNFSANKEDYNITIDDIDCPVDKADT
jgi:hypothetical protein